MSMIDAVYQELVAYFDDVEALRQLATLLTEEVQRRDAQTAGADVATTRPVRRRRRGTGQTHAGINPQAAWPFPTRDDWK